MRYDIRQSGCYFCPYEKKRDGYFKERPIITTGRSATKAEVQDFSWRVRTSSWIFPPAPSCFSTRDQSGISEDSGFGEIHRSMAWLGKSRIWNFCKKWLY